MNMKTKKLNKHKNDKSEEWKQKHKTKADAASERKDAYEKRYAELSSDTRNLVQKAIDQGMNVNVMGIPRSTKRLGERVLRESLASIMAIGTSMIMPVGVGVSLRSYGQGYHYQVRNPKQ